MTKTLEDIKREAVSAFLVEERPNDTQEDRIRRVTIQDTIDYLQAQGLLMVWQPIETAPQKEGEVFICRDSTKPHVQFEAAWFYESEERDGAHVFAPGYYLLQNLTIDIPIDDYSDLEWMPLPKMEVDK